MFFIIFALIFAFATVTAGILILYARWNYGILEKLNIPVLKPHFFLGSLPDLHKKLQQYEDIERYKKFGSVFGAYEGRKPQISICDPELIRLIFVKDFEYFRDRGETELGHPIPNSVLDFLPYESWKHVRSLWSRTFSGGRIKNYSLSIQSLTADFVQNLTKEANANGNSLTIDIRGRLVPLLVDIITMTLFGVKMDEKDNGRTVKLMREVLCEDIRYSPLYNLTLVFPFLKKLFLPFGTTGPEKFRHLILSMLNIRKNQNNNNSKNSDVADTLLDMMSKISSPEYKKLGITEDAVMGFALELFFAIYDSTGTALTFFIHNLAQTQNQNIQNNVLEEVDKVLDDGMAVNHETISNSNIPYLCATLNETLRLTPPFIRAERVCAKDWEFNGLKIPKGMEVILPIFAANRNPEIFPNPDTFDPQRFLEGKLHPYGFTTFGFGPKMCPGIKVADEIMRIILCTILKKFRFEVIEDEQPQKIEFKPGTLFFIQYKPIMVKAVVRN